MDVRDQFDLKISDISLSYLTPTQVKQIKMLIYSNSSPKNESIVFNWSSFSKTDDYHKPIEHNTDNFRKLIGSFAKI